MPYYGSFDARPDSDTVWYHHRAGWIATPIEFRLEEGMSESVRQGILNAGATWNAAVGFELMQFRTAPFSYAGDLWGRLDDGVSTIDLEESWSRTKKSDVILATTVWNDEYDNSAAPTVEDPDVRLIEADIVINGEHYKMGDSKVDIADPSDHCAPEVVDVETLMLHELGHALGLGHARNFEDSVMVPSMYIGELLTRRTLTPLDIARVRYLFVPGEPEPETPAPPPPPPPRPPSTYVPTSNPTPPPIVNPDPCP